MCRSTRLIIGVATCLLFMGTAHATTWYVHPDSALSSIQAALDSCANNDIVLVGPGIYYENIYWPNTQGIDLISEMGPDTTIVDANGVGRVISINAVDTTTVIRGFTIANGFAGASNGGGIMCETSLIIQGNIINGNSATCHAGGGVGGGIVAGDGSIIEDNAIIDNYACRWGGAIACWGSLTLQGNTISGNSDGIYWASLGGNLAMYYNNITGNGLAVLNGSHNQMVINAENNWWGDSTGPYHPDSNPGGLGDEVSDWVDFNPWLYNPWGIEEGPIIKPVEIHNAIGATILRGQLQLPKGKKCKVFDITGRVVEPTYIVPGIYFIEVDGVVTQKVTKVR